MLENTSKVMFLVDINSRVYTTRYIKCTSMCICVKNIISIFEKKKWNLKIQSVDSDFVVSGSEKCNAVYLKRVYSESTLHQQKRTLL